MSTIAEVGVVSGEIVITERKVTSEFAVIEITESIRNRYVRVVVDLGPFPNPETITELRIGSSVRILTVWSDEAYDAVRDTWNNTDLLAAIREMLV